MSSSSMNVVFVVTSAPFPVGGAATMRKMTLSKGFIHYNIHPVLLLYGDFINPQKRNWTGRFFEGIEYVNCTYVIKIGSKVIKRISYAVSILLCGITILKERKKYEGVIIWNNNYNFLVNLFFYFLSKLTRAFFITEVNENPYYNGLIKREFTGPLSKFRLCVTFLMFDKVFAMTFGLKNLLESNIPKIKPVIVVHNTVDFTRFAIKDVKITDYITYLGSLSFEKEGLDLLIEAFSLVRSEVKELKLRIIGNSNKEYLTRIEEYIERFNLRGSVEILFDVSNDRIPELLCESRLLILTRRKNPQTEYGFPTKLVEYLASGRPVVTTNVSDIGYFLKDKISAFIPDNISVDNIASRIKDALNDDMRANEIGQKGREVALEYFSYVKESGKIVNEFLHF